MVIPPTPIPATALENNEKQNTATDILTLTDFGVLGVVRACSSAAVTAEICCCVGCAGGDSAPLFGALE